MHRENGPFQLWTSWTLVIGGHIAALVWVLAGTMPLQKAAQKPRVVQVSLVRSFAKQNLTEEAKPLPTKVKPKPIPQPKMLVVPASVASDPPVDSVAPPIEMTSAATEDTSEGDTVAVADEADYLSNPAPEYPSLSRRRGEEGKVVLRVFVEVDGKPQHIELESSSGFERLDRSALSAVSHWTFTPAKRGEQTVAAWVLVPIVFKIERKS